MLITTKVGCTLLLGFFLHINTSIFQHQLGPNSCRASGLTLYQGVNQRVGFDALFRVSLRFWGAICKNRPSVGVCTHQPAKCLFQVFCVLLLHRQQRITAMRFAFRKCKSSPIGSTKIRTALPPFQPHGWTAHSGTAYTHFSSLLLKDSNDGYSSRSLILCLITPAIRKLFLMPDLNLTVI